MKKTVICDLDGTLVATNTFSRFTLFLMRKPSIFAQVAGVVLKRKLRIISHPQAKQSLLKIASRVLKGADYELFAADMLTRYRHAGVAQLLADEKSAGSLILLATAAPEAYAAHICRMAGMDGYVATVAGGNENRSDEKVRRVREWLAQNDAEVAGVITDHADDLPLMRLAAETDAAIWLVKPSDTTLARTRHLAPQVI